MLYSLLVLNTLNSILSRQAFFLAPCFFPCQVQIYFSFIFLWLALYLLCISFEVSSFVGNLEAMNNVDLKYETLSSMVKN